MTTPDEATGTTPDPAVPQTLPPRHGPAVGTLLCGLVGLAVLIVATLRLSGQQIDTGAAIPLVVLGIGVVVVLAGLVGLRRSRSR